jgi:hypothetical protein
MRRHLFVLAIAGLFGTSFLSNDASACCHKKGCAQPTCAPAPPPPPPAPVCEPVACQPKKCGLFGGHKLFGCCHKQKAAPPPAPVCEVAPSAPAPIPSAQWVAPTPQAAPQALPAPAAPSKQASRGLRGLRVALLGK